MKKLDPDFAVAAGAITLATDIAFQFLLVELIQSGVMPVARALHVLDRAIDYHQKIKGRGWPEDAAVHHLMETRKLLSESVTAVETKGAA